MPRAFVIVLDSVGIGGAPDAADYVNGNVPDSGANTVAHIAQACAKGQADAGRSGPLNVPNLDRLGLGAAVRLAAQDDAPGLDTVPQGLWGVATETSKGKDTPSGHWELAGVPVPWDWHYFSDTIPAFPDHVTKALTDAAGTEGILGNCHAPGIEIMENLGGEHIKTGWPICYTSVDSVLQIAAHEEHFGLERLLAICRAIAPMVHDMKLGRVIARPFVGSSETGFKRTLNRRDFAIHPPAPTLCDWVHDAGRQVNGVGKIGDIFSMRGIDTLVKGSDADLMTTLSGLIETARDGSLTFANLVEFDSHYGHTRDVAGYAGALERFDLWLGDALPRLRASDMLLITADHGNDPTWYGTDHTRERVPVLVAGQKNGCLGKIGFSDVASLVANHLGVSPL